MAPRNMPPAPTNPEQPRHEDLISQRTFLLLLGAAGVVALWVANPTWGQGALLFLAVLAALDRVISRN